MITLIPAIDLIDGHCVRLAQGDYARQTAYAATPEAMAAKAEALGYTRLHIVDLDAALKGGHPGFPVLKAAACATRLGIDFGGGIRNEDDVEEALRLGAEAVCLGSVAVSNFAAVKGWAGRFGADRLIVSADVLDGRVRTHGWTENSGMTVGELLARYRAVGVNRALCTDISRDGMLCGPNTELYRDILNSFPDCRLIASGGISSIADIKALDEAGVPGVVFGRAIFEGRIGLAELAAEFGLQAQTQDKQPCSQNV